MASTISTLGGSVLCAICWTAWLLRHYLSCGVILLWKWKPFKKTLASRTPVEAVPFCPARGCPWPWYTPKFLAVEIFWDFGGWIWHTAMRKKTHFGWELWKCLFETASFLQVRYTTFCDSQLPWSQETHFEFALGADVWMEVNFDKCSCSRCWGFAFAFFSALPSSFEGWGLATRYSLAYIFSHGKPRAHGDSAVLSVL